MAIIQAPPHEVSRTPVHGSRDTGIDLLRALCVTGVVLLHALMVGVTVTDSGPVFANASEGSWWIIPVSWMLQVMPLFFIIGGFSGLISYRRLRERGGSASDFVAARVHRLLRPAVFVIATVGAALAVLGAVGVPADLIVIAGFRYSQPLWFLAVFLLCQALLPALVAAHDRRPGLTVGVLVVSAVAIDALRAQTGIDGLGFINLAFVWLALQQLGFFFAEGSVDRFSRTTRAGIGAAALGILLATFVVGIYSPDLIANINPPTAALLLVGVIHLCAVSLMREHLRDLSRRPLVAAFSTFVNRRAMTVYLWHMPVLLAMAGVCAMAAITGVVSLAEPNSLLWWLERPTWLASALVLAALLSVAFTRLETQAMPSPSTSARRVGAAALLGICSVLLLLLFGTSVPTAAIAVGGLVGALRLARESTPRPAADDVSRGHACAVSASSIRRRGRA